MAIQPVQLFKNPIKNDLIQFEIKFEKYDYFFTKRHNIHYEFVTTSDIENARKMVYMMHGNLIDIFYITEVE